MIQEHAVHVLLGSLRQILTIRRGELCTKARQEPSLSHNNIQHMLAAYLCDRGSRPRQHCVRHVNVLILRILCQSNISVWGMLLLCSITFALDPQVFFHPVFRSQENKLENIEKLGRLNIFWIWNIFGPDHLIFFTVLLRSRNWTATESCKLELETRLGTGFA